MMKRSSFEYGMKVAALAALAASITGCALNSSSGNNGPVSIAGPQLHGSVFGGRQPIVGSTIYLYAVGTSGYASAATNLLTTTVKTDAGGGFGITGAYTCTTGQKLYIVALGGDAGGGQNAQAGIAAALGDCSEINSSTFINMNEVTTVAMAFGLAPFGTSYANVGSSAANAAGIAQAFRSSAKLANVAAGVAGGTVPQGAVTPNSEINALANVLASCVNSVGGVAGDGSNCGSLFALATPSGGTAPTDTIGLAFAIAHNPTLNVASLYNRMPAQSPFAPSLTTAPTDWTMSIVYKGGNFNAPKSTTIDASGNVYVANAGSNTVTVMSQTGTPVATFSGNGLLSPAAVAIDANGNAWVANKGGSTVSAFSSGGSALASSPFAVGSAPSWISFDASGNAWVANSAGNSVSELTASGSLVTTLTVGTTAPVAIAINPK